MSEIYGSRSYDSGDDNSGGADDAYGSVPVDENGSDCGAVFDFLSRIVFGTGKLDEVLPDIAVSTTLPVLATAEILLSLCPREKEWWEYLETIEESIEQAATLQPTVLPALMFRVRSAAARQPRP